MTAFQFVVSDPNLGEPLERLVGEVLEKLASEAAEYVRSELGTFLVTNDVRTVMEAMDRCEEAVGRFLGRIGEGPVHLHVLVPGATAGLELFGEARKRKTPVNLIDILQL
ncbi:MAG: hypothetical protein DIU62_004940 [Pseudomonadota bacterium]